MMWRVVELNAEDPRHSATVLVLFLPFRLQRTDATSTFGEIVSTPSSGWRPSNSHGIIDSARENSTTSVVLL